MTQLRCCLWLLLVFVGWISAVRAYIPAIATNSTQSAIDAGLNITDQSTITVRWYNGSYTQQVSYQLVGLNSTGFSTGVLLHFPEVLAATNETTATPWIALVSCDTNGTNYSLDMDVFTLARDRGAVSALLYSRYSSACIINPEYASPEHFDQVFDIFSTKSLASAILLLNQFGQSGASNQSMYSYFNAETLNASSYVIDKSLKSGQPIEPGYLIASLVAYNATEGSPSPTPTDNAKAAGGNTEPTNSGLAMIVLYAITGCVSALFIVVILCGAVRAIRHPERYGPRAGMDAAGFGTQSRARGLTRAILDTFPIVKFGSGLPPFGAAGAGGLTTARGSKDLEVTSSVHGVGMEAEAEMEMPDWKTAPTVKSEELTVTTTSRQTVPGPSGSNPPSPTATKGEPDRDRKTSGLTIPRTPEHDATASASRLRPWRDRKSSISVASSPTEDVVPAAIGRETCPICIVDFEEGDDLRVLPCEGKHRFHQACVDPWLLELSSSCPICREDFLALENMLSGESEEGEVTGGPRRASNHHSQNRFSRYIRFARRRRQDHHPQSDAHPPLPPSPRRDDSTSDEGGIAI